MSSNNNDDDAWTRSIDMRDICAIDEDTNIIDTTVAVAAEIANDETTMDRWSNAIIEDDDDIDDVMSVIQEEHATTLVSMREKEAIADSVPPIAAVRKRKSPSSQQPSPSVVVLPIATTANAAAATAAAKRRRRNADKLRDDHSESSSTSGMTTTTKTTVTVGKRAVTPPAVTDDDDIYDDPMEPPIKKSKGEYCNDVAPPPPPPAAAAPPPPPHLLPATAAVAAVSMVDMWNDLATTINPDYHHMRGMDDMFGIDEKAHKISGGTLDGYEMRSVYALLSRLDPDKCATVTEYISANGAAAIKLKTDSALWSLWRLGRFAKRHSIDIINLSSRCWLDLNDKYEDAGTETMTTDVANDDDESSVITRGEGGGGGNNNDDGGNDDEIYSEENTRGRRHLMADDDKVSDRCLDREVAERAKVLIGRVDYCAKELLLRLGQIRGSKFFSDLLPERMTALSFSDPDNKLSYDEYAMTRMRYRNFHNDTVYVNGFYLISLKPAVSSRTIKFKFPAYEDRFGYLTTIATRYVREKMFGGQRLPDNARIFVNLTTTQACADFNILKPLPNDVLSIVREEDNAAMMSSPDAASSSKRTVGRSDINGSLGLVQFGNITHDSKKEYISIRGYLTATFSSSKE